MKTIYKTAITAIAAVLLFAACGNAGAKTTERKGKGVTELNSETFNKKVYDMRVQEQKYLGDKPAIVDFTASWCGPCQMEMPDFDEKYKELGEEVHFLMVNMTDGSQETIEKAKKFVEDSGYSFPVYYDTDLDAAYKYGVNSIPATYFIDKSGRAIARGQGAIDAETLQYGIDMLTK